MPRALPPRLGPLAAVVLLLGTLGACGGNDTSDSDGPSSAVSAPVGGQSGGGGAGDGLLGVCAVVTADELAKIVGGALTASPNPGGGCLFTQAEDFTLPSVGFGEKAYTDDNGGLAGAQTGLEAVITGGRSSQLDLGDGAVIVTGHALGSERTSGSGLIHVGGSLVQVDLTPGGSEDPTAVTRMLTDLLTLVASKA